MQVLRSDIKTKIKTMYTAPLKVSTVFSSEEVEGGNTHKWHQLTNMEAGGHAQGSRRDQKITRS